MTQTSNPINPNTADSANGAAALTPLLLEWYRKNKRDLPWRKNNDPYRVWVSEIMLQQTRVQTGLLHYERFINEFPDVHALARASEERLMKAWEGLGYYARARNMHKTAMIISAAGGAFPDSYEEWRKLPGVGEYTAGAVASIAFGERVGAVDGNAVRVLMRYAGDTDPVDAAKKKMLKGIVSAILPDCSGEFNQALMDLGAMICTPGEPQCSGCPLQTHCTARKLNLAAKIPVKKQKTPRKIEKRTIVLAICGDRVAFRKRDASSVLKNMWEPLNFSGYLTETNVRLALKERGFQPTGISKLLPAKHIFTHLEWHMHGYACSVRDTIPEYSWFTADQLRDEIAIPSAFRRYIDRLHILLPST